MKTVNFQIEIIHQPPNTTDENRTTTVKIIIKFQDTGNKNKPPGRGLGRGRWPTKDQKTTTSYEQQPEARSWKPEINAFKILKENYFQPKILHLIKLSLKGKA